jgi:hypothetical protein
MHSIDSIHTTLYALVKLEQESRLEAARRERHRRELLAARRDDSSEPRRRWWERARSLPAAATPASA